MGFLVNSAAPRTAAAVGLLATIAATGVVCSQRRTTPDPAVSSPAVSADAAPPPSRVDRAPSGAPDALPTAPESAWRDLDGGVRVADLAVGSGVPANTGQIVTVDYAVWTASGQLVEHSLGRDRAMRYQVGAAQVFSAWDMATLGLAVGGRRLVYAPAATAFGHSGARGVPPDTDVVVDLRLVAVEAPRVEPPAPPFDLAAMTDAGDGLKLRDLEVGRGEPPGPGTTARIDWTIWSMDGQRVATSWTRGRSELFVMDDLRAPLVDLLPGMRTGGRRLVLVPAALRPGIGSLGAELPADAPVFLDITLQAVER